MSNFKTLSVALIVALVCGLLISVVAFSLKDARDRNADVKVERKLLEVAGLYEKGMDEAAAFRQHIRPVVVDLNLQKVLPEANPKGLELRKMLEDPSQSRALSEQENVAKLEGARVETRVVVYVVRGERGAKALILPIRGYGLWSTMKGFLALGSDLNTILGITFVDHGETPGLGAKIDEPSWQALWKGKKLFSEKGALQLRVVKAGAVTAENTQIDGLSGATLTTMGVDHLMQFWFGEVISGTYGPLLHNPEFKQSIDALGAAA